MLLIIVLLTSAIALTKCSPGLELVVPEGTAVRYMPPGAMPTSQLRNGEGRPGLRSYTMASDNNGGLLITKEANPDGHQTVSVSEMDQTRAVEEIERLTEPLAKIFRRLLPAIAQNVGNTDQNIRSLASTRRNLRSFGYELPFDIKQRNMRSFKSELPFDIKQRNMRSFGPKSRFGIRQRNMRSFGYSGPYGGK